MNIAQLIKLPFKVKTDEWHLWFCWYPVCSIEYGWVWFRWLSRKKISPDYVKPYLDSIGRRFSQRVTGCWHRIPETW